MYQNTVAHQLLKFQNSAGFSQAKFPMFVASSSVPLGLWEEFRNGKEIALTPFFFILVPCWLAHTGWGWGKGLWLCGSKDRIIYYILHFSISKFFSSHMEE